MTLSTNVAIGKPHNVREVFEFCRGLLGTPDGTPVREGAGYLDERTKRIGNPIGIGLPALLDITYGPDGPLTHRCDRFCSTELGGEFDTTQEQIDDHTRYVAESPTQNGWAAMIVDFDTAYGWRGEGGETCSDLHARLVTALGQWLDARGLPWKWQNEYTGEWFDRYDGLAEFGNAHRATGADAWFRNQVVPAIQAHAAVSSAVPGEPTEGGADR
ncbi:hypothetical protein DMP17_22060 [Pseudonocardia sp. TMWB2A]|uniref:hypothetical protein n=1 Tax=Pseudonocardia sp. TMWB2A TaxID=687430 RepID=UPI00307F4AB5